MVLDFGGKSRDHNVIILVLKEKGDRFERIGMITLRGAVKSTNEASARPTMYRDKSGGWMKRAPTTMPQGTIWQKELEKKTIVLQ